MRRFIFALFLSFILLITLHVSSVLACPTADIPIGNVSVSGSTVNFTIQALSGSQAQEWESQSPVLYIVFLDSSGTKGNGASVTCPTAGEQCTILGFASIGYNGYNSIPITVQQVPVGTWYIDLVDSDSFIKQTGSVDLTGDCISQAGQPSFTVTTPSPPNQNLPEGSACDPTLQGGNNASYICVSGTTCRDSSISCTINGDQVNGCRAKITCQCLTPLSADCNPNGGNAIPCDVCDDSTHHGYYFNEKETDPSKVCVNVNGSIPPMPALSSNICQSSTTCYQGCGCQSDESQCLNLLPGVAPIACDTTGCHPQFCDSSGCYTALGFVPTQPEKFIPWLFALFLALSGSIAVFLIIVSGFKFLSSQGKPESLQNAREQLTAAIVGLLFVIFSFALLQLIGVNILKIFSP